MMLSSRQDILFCRVHITAHLLLAWSKLLKTLLTLVQFSPNRHNKLLTFHLIWFIAGFRYCTVTRDLLNSVPVYVRICAIRFNHIICLIFRLFLYIYQSGIIVFSLTVEGRAMFVFLLYVGYKLCVYLTYSGSEMLSVFEQSKRVSLIF